MPRHQSCSIPGCPSRSDKPEFTSIKFHRLPQDSDLRQQWLVSIKKTLCVSESTRICSAHFAEGEKNENSSVPSVFPWSKPVKRRRPPAVRHPLPLKKPKQVETPSAVNAIEQHEEKISELQLKVLRLEEEVRTLESQRFLLRRFQGSDKDIQFYTGLPSYSVLMCLYRFLEPLLCYLRLCRNEIKSTSTSIFKPRARALQPIDEFFLTLVRLRLGLLEQDLAHRFNISIATVSRICITWIKFLNQQLRPLITWPSRECIDAHMPAQFVEFCPTTRVILDCTEFFTEVPSSMSIQSLTYSSYKHHNTFKALVGISPTGAVTFISDLYAGSVSDQALTRECGVLDHVMPGDTVMADKGFDISYDVLVRGAKLNIPPFVKNHQQLSKKNVIITRKIASLRIHVERAIGRVKQYRILSNVVPLSLVHSIDSIWGICCSLSLFHPPLVTDPARLSEKEISEIIACILVLFLINVYVAVTVLKF